METKKTETLSYYIKERHNPQFKKPYFVPEGLLPKKEAKAKEDAIYGMNIMLKYKNIQEYKAAIQKFKIDGFSVHQ